jgi:hypothetical protein
MSFFDDVGGFFKNVGGFLGGMLGFGDAPSDTNPDNPLDDPPPDTKQYVTPNPTLAGTQNNLSFSEFSQSQREKYDSFLRPDFQKTSQSSNDDDSTSGTFVSR